MSSSEGSHIPDPPIDNCGEGSLCCPDNLNLDPRLYLVICFTRTKELTYDQSTVSIDAEDLFYVYKDPLPDAISIGARVTSFTDLGDGLWEATIQGFAMIGGAAINNGYTKTLQFNARADNTYLLGTINPLDWVDAGIANPVDGVIDIVITTDRDNPSHHFRQLDCCKVSILNINGPITDPDHDRSTASIITKNIASIANTAQQLEVTLEIKLSDQGNIEIAYNNYIFKLVNIDASTPPDNIVQDNDIERQFWVQQSSGGNWPGPGPNEKFIVKLKLQDDVCPEMTSANLDRFLEFKIRDGTNRRYFNLVEVAP